MKNIIYVMFIIILNSCGGSQFFLEARTNYDVPLNEYGSVDFKSIGYDFENLQGLNSFNPQVRLTYRQYLFDGKRKQIKRTVRKQVKKQLQMYNIKEKQ
jgi:hypothetical protein